MKPALILLSFACATTHAATIESDICVYGGTSGGVAAAVQAARMGKKVILAESGKHLGGMTSGGLSAVDIGDPRSSMRGHEPSCPISYWSLFMVSE